MTTIAVAGSVGERLREPLLHLGAGDRVERGEGLVEQQHRLLGEQRAQERDPLAHPAGQLSRPRRLEAGEPEALEQRPGELARLALGGAAVARRERRVVDRRQPGKQQVALRHVRAARQPLRACAFTPDGDLAAARLAQAADQLEQGRLPATRGSDEAEDLARRRP